MGMRRQGFLDALGSAAAGWPCCLDAHPFFWALISPNVANARANTSLKSHIKSRISRMVADVFALSALPMANMLLLRKYPMIRGSEIL